MEQRDALPGEGNTIWGRRALLLAIPLILAGVAWKIHDLQKPISVSYGPEDIQSRVLFQRMAKEAKEHPYASNISVGWSRPWPKGSGLDISDSEVLNLNRGDGSLEYGILDSGWIYHHVELSGIELLAKAQLPMHPVSLSPSLDAQLRNRGWTP